ncbi:MAG: type-F conjugative transfer system pilin assembly protein TrbC [Rubrivivax sp.]
MGNLPSITRTRPLGRGLSLGALLLAGTCGAQVPVVMPADLQRAASTIPTPAQIEAAQGLAAPAAQPGRPAVDLQRMARDYEGMRGGRAPAAPEDSDRRNRTVSGVMLFVSLTMPDETLRRIVDDAMRMRAALILRGVLPGLAGQQGSRISLDRTKQRIAALTGKRQVAWQIDPMLFRRFEVQAVPALVLIDPASPVLVDCGATQCRRPSFAKVTGDVSASYALGLIEAGDSGHAELAARYIAQLRRE